MKMILISCLGALLALPLSAAGPVLTISNKAGKSLVVELLELKDEGVRVRLVENKAKYDIPFDQLSPESVEALKEKGANLPAVYPELELDVVVKKRRKDLGSSYYMKAMTVGGTVKVENRSQRRDCPPSFARLVFVGQDQRTPEKFTVLAVRDLELAPKAGQVFEQKVEDFETQYDSDNKGQGNIGGYKYFGYLLLVHDGEGRIVEHKTVSGVIAKAVSDNQGVLGSMLKTRPGAMMDDQMLP
ncbi:MAG: hypothetical protein ACQKBY_11825 [Verrucomicrobiales bacterium]